MEFYTALLRFVTYKLFSDLGMPYPFSTEDFPLSETNQLFYDCAKIREMQARTRKLFSDGQKQDEVVDKEFENTPEMQRLRRREE